jgi:hemerythrin-like metal-binding protein
MPLIEWTKKLETGIAKIDFQHRNLVNMINELEKANQEANTKVREVVVEVNLKRLIEYTNYHLQAEEEILKSCDYNEYTQHKKIHDDLKLKASDLATRFGKGEDVTEKLLLFLKSWLENHILGTDMKYVPTVKNKFPDL